MIPEPGRYGHAVDVAARSFERLDRPPDEPIRVRVEVAFGDHGLRVVKPRRVREDGRQDRRLCVEVMRRYTAGSGAEFGSGAHLVGPPDASDEVFHPASDFLFWCLV